MRDLIWLKIHPFWGAPCFWIAVALPPAAVLQVDPTNPVQKPFAICYARDGCGSIDAGSGGILGG
jgi:hypothetical protein